MGDGLHGPRREHWCARTEILDSTRYYCKGLLPECQAQGSPTLFHSPPLLTFLQLTDSEQNNAMSMGVDEVLFRRILIMLSFKQAYINAINQPAGFDFRRISCDFQPGKERVTVDGKPLVGWEVYMFKSNLGVQRRETIVEEIYQCCALIFRGWANGNQWNWNSKKGDMDESLNFLKVDQIVKAYDGLGDGKRKLAHYKSEKRKRAAAENAERDRIEQQGNVQTMPMPPPAAAIQAP